MTIPFSVLKQPQLSKWWLIAEVKDWRVRLEKRVSVYMQWYESLFVVYTFLTARSLGQSTFKQVQRVNFVQTIVQHALWLGICVIHVFSFLFFLSQSKHPKRIILVNGEERVGSLLLAEPCSSFGWEFMENAFISHLHAQLVKKTLCTNKVFFD